MCLLSYVFQSLFVTIQQIKPKYIIINNNFDNLKHSRLLWNEIVLHTMKYLIFFQISFTWRKKKLLPAQARVNTYRFTWPHILNGWHYVVRGAICISIPKIEHKHRNNVAFSQAKKTATIRVVLVATACYAVQIWITQTMPCLWLRLKKKQTYLYVLFPYSKECFQIMERI